VAWWGLVNWWADIACLACAMRAAGLPGLSIGKILVVWTAGAGAASLSPTPAGIGAVEIAMVAALSAVGAKGPSAITAVLVYRVIALKGAVSLWAIIYSWLRRPRPAAGPAESTPPAIPGSAPPEGSH
jgi:putative heme transporter